jgi:hypothetical protein
VEGLSYQVPRALLEIGKDAVVALEEHGEERVVAEQ